MPNVSSGGVQVIADGVHVEVSGAGKGVEGIVGMQGVESG